MTTLAIDTNQQIFENENELSAQTKLNILLVLMADTRATTGDYQKELADLNEQIKKAFPRYDVLLSEIKELKKNETEIYAFILKFAKELFAETGVKKLNDYVTITEKTCIKYDPAKAVAWAIEKKLNNLLLIDEGEFSKVAEVIKPDFVEFEVSQSMRLATDLSRLKSSQPQEESPL